VRFTFGIPGTHNIELYDALERSSRASSPILVTSRGGAAFMADGSGAHTGDVGVLNVVPGAGVTHCMSAIAEAYMDQRAVGGDRLRHPLRHRHGLPTSRHVDQMAVLDPVTKGAHRIRRAAIVSHHPSRLRSWPERERPGPVGVEIPAELMMLTQEVAPGSP
jgi:acetolactate synthase-1/2/3 large subunit